MRLAARRHRSAALQLISTRMLSGVGGTLILLILITATTNAREDVLDNSTLSPSRGAVELPQVRRYGQLHISPSHLSKPGDGKKIPPPSDKKTKPALDNNTGLRKSDVHPSNRLPANGVSGRPGKVLQDGNQADSILAARVYEIPDHESNRPGKPSPRATKASQNSSKAARTSNRHPASLLHHPSVFRKDPDSKDRTCVTECHKERDEREAYCHSDFAVNGIVHDVDAVAKGIQLLTVLVNSGGFYKMNRLYITPDGVFFRVRILAVDDPHCHTPCLHLKLGGRYIIMGQIYHKRMELPSPIQRVISGRLRAGDGLVTSGRSFIRRYNRKKDRRVLAAAHTKCK